MPLNSRNASLGFAERTRTNLEFAYENNESVHLVTQTTNSLLGLVVFPWEANFDKRLAEHKLVDLESDGWPRWQQKKEQVCSTLGELIEQVRHGTCHRHLEFSSDSRDPKEVKIRIWNKYGKKADWEAEISAEDLRVFCLKLAKLVEDTIG